MPECASCDEIFGKLFSKILWNEQDIVSKEGER
jgi:hypothetical protein